MPRGGKKSWRDDFLEEKKNMKGKGGAGKNPFATPIPKAHKKLKNEQKGYNV